MNGSARLRILFLPAWYPSEGDPLEGVFVREHARAASRYHDVVVLYGYGDFSPSLRLWRMSEAVEEGIRTIRVRYGGLVSYLWRATRSREQREGSSSDSGVKSAGRLIKLLGLPKALGADLLWYVSLFVAFRRLVRGGWRPDVIHAHVYTAGVPAVMLGKLYRVPVVLTEHFSGLPRHLLNRTERLKAKCAMNRAHMILPVSDYLRGHIESYGIKNEFKVIPNVVDTRLFCPAPPSNEERPDAGTKLLFVGSLVPVKGVPYLLEALSQIRQKRQDFVLDVVGDGVSRGEYEELVSRLGLDGVVNFHGRKPKEEVAGFMGKCAFLVQPSLQETFGVVYIEAMACGKPVIATNVGGPNEFVNDDAGILVPPEDTGALYDAIEYMLDNYEGYSSESIARYTRERFSYDSVARMLDEAYRQVLEGSKKG